MNVKIEPGWAKALQTTFEQPYFQSIKKFLVEEYSAGNIIYPPAAQIFNAFNLSSFENTKVIILGQDPYHGPGQAHGLCFSVPDGIKPPPSLVNIYKEIASDLNIKIPTTGNLTSWAQQGVLLLNAFLTVRANAAASHKPAGREHFTDDVIRILSNQKEHLVFLLWGRFAQDKSNLIDSKKHLILKAAHPSPLSVYNGFFGCKHFSQTNQFLTNHRITPIQWQIQ